MLDQSFSSNNFRKILDYENRRGMHVEAKLSMHEVVKINQMIKECNASIRNAKRANDGDEVNRLYEEKFELRNQREETLQIELQKISALVTSKEFQFVLKRVTFSNFKPIYISPRTPDQYFVLKQTQKNLSKLYRVKQANRDIIVEQLISLLGDLFPKIVIRTDIKDFYESIPRNKMLFTIEESSLLSPFTRAFLRKILDEYYSVSGSMKGIPRGIGVSAYLAELYMRDIDRRILGIPGLTYYARYVDDIIAIFTPIPGDCKRYYRREIKEAIERRTSLIINSGKTQIFDLISQKIIHRFDYLGYKFTFGQGPTTTRLSDKKIKKYRSKLKVTFDHYRNFGKVDEPSARNLLVKRIRFLTGNTRLLNNKKNILTGVYHSNRQLTEEKDFRELDAVMMQHINRKISSPHLKQRLLKFSFLEGFTKKRFSPFTTSELEEITKIWKPRLFS